MLGVKVAPSDFFIPAFLYLAVVLIGNATCTGQLHALPIVPMFYPIRKGAGGWASWPSNVKAQRRAIARPLERIVGRFLAAILPPVPEGVLTCL